MSSSGTPNWIEVAAGVWRSTGWPCAYALVEGGRAVVMGAARGASLEALGELGAAGVDFVLLTHHHRDAAARAAEWLAAGLRVRGPRDGAAWLTPEGARQFWDTALPRPAVGYEPPLRERTFGEWNYLVLPEGLAGIDCSLEDGVRLRWQGWEIEAFATPGHSRDHLSFAARRAAAPADAAPIVFCGDALCAAGKLWSPYTTDWDHWQGEGLAAAATSCRRLAALRPGLLLPEHGPPIAQDTIGALELTAQRAEEAALLKSFEQYSEERVGNTPQYRFLAPKQVATAGDEPWSQLTEHLYLTGNTYALVSRDGGLLLIDPFGPQIAEQVQRLRDKTGCGPPEICVISHAHNDHYKGLYLLGPRSSFQVWTLDEVARVLGEPYRYCAPYLDARPVAVDRVLRDGEGFHWREYEFRACHLPGQTVFSMGLQATIDGRRCFHTADNFFHAEQFTGSGGWSGRNRAWPEGYAQSAQKVLDAAPDWVLAEHGGAMEFNREDFLRRVAWTHAAAAACDALCPSGDHRRDWDPQRVRIEPVYVQAARGEEVVVTLVWERVAAGDPQVTVSLAGRGVVDDVELSRSLPAGGSPLREALTLRVRSDAPAGWHVLPVVAASAGMEGGSEAFVVVEIAEQ